MGLISNGATIFDNGSMASGFGGNLNFISKATASSSASIEFSLGDYKEYQFYFVNMHPQTDDVYFQFNLSTDNGSNYNVTKTSTYFMAYHGENDAGAVLTYDDTLDLAQSTSNQNLLYSLGADADQNASGTLQLFNPSSTTYVKHWIANTNNAHYNNFSFNTYISGYANTTSALTNIKFQMSSGNIDAGEILLFGVS